MDLMPAAELSLRELSTLFARSFEGYFVTIPDAPLLFDARVRSDPRPSEPLPGRDG